MNDSNNYIVCKNCDTQFEGNYCNNCGQSSKDYDKPFNVLIIDAMANIWAFDTRLWKTLKSIMLKPGEMAANYINGKRVRYMPPFRLYLFVSFIFFMLLRLSSSSVDINKEQQETKSSVVVFDKEYPQSSPDKFKKELLIANFFNYMSWALIIMMPVYALVLWSLFRKNERHFLVHFIFSLNQHTFLFILLSLLIAVNLIFPEKDSYYEAWILMLYPAYLIVGGRELYKSKWRSIIFRMLTAFIIYQIIIISTFVFVGLFMLHKMQT